MDVPLSRYRAYENRLNGVYHYRLGLEYKGVTRKHNREVSKYYAPCGLRVTINLPYRYPRAR